MFEYLKDQCRGLGKSARANWRLPCAAALGLMTSAPLLAHHSYVMFNRGKIATITGTVGTWQWTNPHIYLRMKPAGPGQPEIVFEGHSPSIYRKAGIGRDITGAGQKVTLTYHPMADGKPGGQILSINGKGTD